MNTPNMAEGFTRLADVYRHALETATGMREQALRDGYNETAAEQIAVSTYMAICQGIAQ